MSPALASSAPSELNHWWTQLRFRLQNKKGWNEMLDETFLIYTKNVSDIPLFYAAKNNSVGCIRKLLNCSSTNIFERGALGETALHVAVMNDNADAAVALMDGAPELINEPMTSEIFQGITPLHIAVVNQNIDLVEQLIRRGGDVSAPRVTGLYFKKRKGGLMYCGEHILSFAACTGNLDIMTMLMDNGASTRVQDYKGNTLLHILVLQPHKTFACQAMDLIMTRDAELDHMIPLDMVPNSRGLTPFKLAAKEGNTVVFQHLVNKRRAVQWNLGPLTSYLYDLTEIDSWADSMSVLEVIVSSPKKEARQILEITPVRQLVSLKWNLYGKHYLRLLLLVYLLYIVTFTLICVYRPLKDAGRNISSDDPIKTILIQKTLSESYVTYGDSLRLVGEIISLVGAILILVLEIPDILRVGAKRYFGQTALGGPFHVILIVYAILVVLLTVLRLTEMQGETEIMAIALILGWSNVLFFARGFESLGPFVIMIQKIILGDLVKYMWLLIIMLMAFTTSIWMVYMTQDPLSLSQYRSFPLALYSQFELSVSMIDLPMDNSIQIPPINQVILAAFSVICCTLLLNLLIAMMSDTQWRVAQERDELWRTQVVATTLMVERRLPRCLWCQIGVCGLTYGLKERWYLRVENRNDMMLQKMRRYVKAFSKENENEEGEEKSDAANGSPILRSESKNARNKKAVAAWDVVRLSTLGLDMEMEIEEPEDIKEIKYV
ncbi:transient receptor potential cation channel subfamily V member 6 [Nothobranchius furzeri]|uniref:Transient receptor potential cation channel subfamily V member 5-like n=2 Tax=Nothobranchius furzeri TaxID=105023 RepID=A0A9D2YTU9_NOTFU|nr:transient receptor potential cation channel subfamily V member 6 isoform X2 [Nothobranchius furzeri]KAF7226906.1 transient receptor potential cation channel subfamily V member 5-like [Nothobranchius furzeri]